MAPDWHEWHRAYDRPDSPLSQRLAIVRRLIGDVLDASGPSSIRLISMCAGEARDLAGIANTHGRVIELEEGTSESGSEVVIELSSVKRLRPDGMMRSLPIERKRQKLGIADSVYEELRASRGGEVELLAGNDSFVVASLDGARRRLTR